jgi:hypothetical protein
MLVQVGVATLGGGTLWALGMRDPSLGFLGGMAVALLELLLLMLTARMLGGKGLKSAAMLLPFSLAKFALLGVAVWSLVVLARLPILPVVGGFTAGLMVMLLSQLAGRASRDGDEQKG